MRTLVIYESMYGNTHAVANEIADGLRSAGSVRVATTDAIDGDDVAECDLVVVGGPTHIHGMTSERSRKAAADAAAEDPELDLDDSAGGPGLRQWIDRLPKGGDVAVATFDTRIDKPAILTGSAARGIAKRLRRHGYRSIVEPESFFVADTEGPLLDGEAERARRWGAGLVARLRHDLEQ